MRYKPLHTFTGTNTNRLQISLRYVVLFHCEHISNTWQGNLDTANSCGKRPNTQNSRHFYVISKRKSHTKYIQTESRETESRVVIILNVAQIHHTKQIFVLSQHYLIDIIQYILLSKTGNPTSYHSLREVVHFAEFPSSNRSLSRQLKGPPSENYLRSKPKTIRVQRVAKCLAYQYEFAIRTIPRMVERFVFHLTNFNHAAIARTLHHNLLYCVVFLI